ncbi:MAG: ice-binding family protein [Polyangiaceae bacterium]
MDGSTLSETTFTLVAQDTQAPVLGDVTYAGTTAVFAPAQPLEPLTTFVATIAATASSEMGIPLAAPYSWTFTTAAVLVPGVPVPLGESGDYVILAKSAISTVPPSAITGDLGISPAAATFVTGFSLTADATNLFSTSAQVTGSVYSATHASPTPINLTTAVSDMELAFTAAAGRAPDVTELGAGNIGGMTLSSGVYGWSTGLLVPTDVALTGSSTDVWIFQIAQDLSVSNGVQINLSGGALPENVFWQVSGKVELGTTSQMQGIVLAQTSIAAATGASIQGRLLAQTAVTLDSATVIEPTP